MSPASPGLSNPSGDPTAATPAVVDTRASGAGQPSIVYEGAIQSGAAGAATVRIAARDTDGRINATTMSVTIAS